MALYIFEHPQTGETREVYFKLDDKKEYFGEEDEDKIKWHRRFTIPYASSNTKVSDPFSQKDFVNSTDKKNITFGEMWDASAAMSEKRAKINGEDPVKAQYYDKYAESRNGLKHLRDGREKKAVQEKFGKTKKPKAPPQPKRGRG
jgi:hypothetical protein